MLAESIVGHLVGDYLLQNDWMALNKKRSTFHCTVHCLIWTLCVVMFGSLPLWTSVPLFLTHFVQDRTNVVSKYMSAIGQQKFRDGPCGPWSIIVVDNVMHILVIYFVVLNS